MQNGKKLQWSIDDTPKNYCNIDSEIQCKQVYDAQNGVCCGGKDTWRKSCKC